jgi:hypothetical protein
LKAPEKPIFDVGFGEKFPGAGITLVRSELVSLVVGSESDYFDYPLVRIAERVFALGGVVQNLINEAMLTVDSAGTGSAQVPRQPLKRGRILERIGGEYGE